MSPFRVAGSPRGCLHQEVLSRAALRTARQGTELVRFCVGEIYDCLSYEGFDPLARQTGQVGDRVGESGPTDEP